MPTRLLHLSDLHLNASGSAGAGVDADLSLALVLEACDQIDGLAAVVVTGDIADDGSAPAYERARAALLAFAQDHGAHLVLSTGNHDDRAKFSQVLGHGHFRPDGTAWGQAGPASRVCGSSTVGGLRIVTLDSLVPGKWFGRLDTAQLDWLRDLLASEPDLPTVIAFHHPPITLDVEIQRRVRLEDGEDLAAVLQYGNPVAVLCGHFHQQIAGQLGGVPTWVTPGVYTRIDHLTGTAGRERATAGGSATLVDLATPSSPTFTTMAASDPNLGAEVYVTSVAELDDELREYGIPTQR